MYSLRQVAKMTHIKRDAILFAARYCGLDIPVASRGYAYTADDVAKVREWFSYPDNRKSVVGW